MDADEAALHLRMCERFTIHFLIFKLLDEPFRKIVAFRLR